METPEAKINRVANIMDNLMDAIGVILKMFIPNPVKFVIVLIDDKPDGQVVAVGSDFHEKTDLAKYLAAGIARMDDDMMINSDSIRDEHDASGRTGYTQ